MLADDNLVDRCLFWFLHLPLEKREILIKLFAFFFFLTLCVCLGKLSVTRNN
jgi:hypothetical protein